MRSWTHDLRALGRRGAESSGRHPRSVVVVIVGGSLVVAAALTAWQVVGNETLPWLERLANFAFIGFLACLLGAALSRALKLGRVALERSEALLAGEANLKREADEHQQLKREFQKLADELAECHERCRLGEDVKKRLNFLEALLNAIPSPVFLVDTDGIYRQGNEAHARDVLGMPMDQIVGKTIAELSPAIPANLGALYAQRNRDLLETGGIQRYEIPARCADGVQRDFFVIKTVFRGETGQPEGLIAVMFDISKRKRMERSTDLNERQLAQAMGIARLAHWQLDLTTETFTFNDRFYSLHCTTADREGGYQMSMEVYAREFLFPEDASLLHDSLARAKEMLGPRPTYQTEYRIRRRDGETGYVLTWLELTKNGAGAIVDATGTTQDITLRRTAEEGLNLLWAAVEQSPAVVMITDDTGRIEYVNQRFVETTGLTAAEARGKNPRILKSGYHTAEFYRDLWQTVKGGNRWQGEFRNRKKDGTLYWEASFISPVRNHVGNITHFIAVREDVSARKKADDELKNAEAALRQQEALLRSITGTIPYACYVADVAADKILYANRRFSELWGLEHLQQQLARGEVAHSGLVPPVLSQVADPAAFEQHIARLESAAAGVPVEADVPLCDGRILHHFTMYVRDESNKTLGRLSLTQDVTAQRRAERQLSTSLAQKEVLLREVYHRVKNNLQVISSLLNLQSITIIDPKTRRLVRETQDRIRSMALVHEKLYRAGDLSKINFGEYAQQLVTMLARSYRTHGHPVELRFSLEEVSLSLDTAIPCGLILNELISNVLKHAFPETFESERREIHVQLRAAGPGCYVLTVADNGRGLPEHVNIHTTTTLGLQVVTMLAEQLSGSLAVQRTGGTAFELTFREINEGPDAPPNNPAAAANQPRPAPAPTQPSTEPDLTQ